MGVTGAWATENSRPAIFEALRSRRTVACTGDRIEVDFRCDDTAWMGSVVNTGVVDLTWSVRGWDFIKQIELVRDNVPVHVRLPDYAAEAEDSAAGDRAGEGQLYRLRLEWGWGPMKGYQVYDWEGELELSGGHLLQVVPCFVSDPFDEERRKVVDHVGDAGCSWRSHTSRGGIFTTRNGTPACAANDAICLEVRGDEDTRLSLALRCTTRKSLLATSSDWSISPNLGSKQLEFTIGELLRGRQGHRMDDVPTWVVAHRAVPEALYSLSGAYALRSQGGEGCYYLRVTQENGQMAWSSPIWVDA